MSMEFLGPNRRRFSTPRETSPVARSQETAAFAGYLSFIDILRFILYQLRLVLTKMCYKKALKFNFYTYI